MDPYQFFLSLPVLAFLGLYFGSFLNVVIHRVPLMMERQWAMAAAEEAGQPIVDAGGAVSLASPGSRCPQCGREIRWLENIPVLSYLMLKGRCAGCGAAISVRYPLVELGTCLLFAAVSLRFGPVPEALLWCTFAAALIALAGIDWDTTYLPDGLTYTLLWAGLVASSQGWLSGLTAHSSILGAVWGYLSLWSVYWVFKLVTGKEGMGHGDFKLLAAIGAWLGWQGLFQVVLMASVLATVVGVWIKLRGELREGVYFPFGPFLAGAAMLSIFLPPARVLRWLI